MRRIPSIRRIRSVLLLGSGFVLGSLSTVGVLSWFGELGGKYYLDGPSETSVEAGATTVSRARREPPRGIRRELSRTETPGDIPRPPVGAGETLLGRNPVVPVRGVDPKSIQDTFDERRGLTRKHEATDIIAPRGTPVVAFDDGIVQKLFESKQGGLTVYQFDRDETFCYYYAHLDRYAEGLKEGKFLKRGDRIGDVGTTGNAPTSTPHLHFAIFQLGPEKRWWQGTPIDPYPILAALARRRSG